MSHIFYVTLFITATFFPGASGAFEHPLTVDNSAISLDHELRDDNFDDGSDDEKCTFLSPMCSGNYDCFLTLDTLQHPLQHCLNTLDIHRIRAPPTSGFDPVFT